MKMKLLFTYFLCGCSAILTAQIKIGDNPQNIDATSVLELESTDRVLVITRVNTGQMNAIVPNQGAMVYNTDEQCIFYFDGIMWQNLCATNGGDPNDELNTLFEVNTGFLEITDAGATLQVPISDINTDDQDAFEVPFMPYLSIGATDTQTAIEELKDEVDVISGGGGNPTDELNLSFAVNAGDLEIVDAGGTLSVPLNVIDTDNQNLNLTGNVIDIEDGNSIDLTPILGAGGSDDQQLSLGGNTLTLEDGGTVDLSGYLDNTDDQNLNLTGNVIDIEDGNSIDLTPILGAGGSDDQQLSLSSNTLTLEDGGTVDLSGYLDNTDDQNLNLTGNVIDIEDGNSIDLTPILGAGGSDDQQLTLSGNTLTLEDGGTVDLSGYLDNTDDQNLNLTGNVIDIEDGNSIDLTPILGAGGSDDQNIQGSLLTGETLTIGIEDGATEDVDLSLFATDADLAASDAADLDMDSTNEIQDLAAVLTEGADAGASLISNVLDPVSAQDVATRAYVDANGGGHTGTTGSVFFADDITGAPTEDNDSFFWDSTARFGSGALFVGTDGNPISDVTKVHIMEKLPGNIAFPLQIQNNTETQTGHDNDQSTVGLLFAVEALGAFGKGALAFERKGTFGVGSFHFLQDAGATTDNPDINDAVVTITSAGDLGVGTVTPSSTLEIDGSFAAKIRTAAAGTVNDDDHTVVFTTTGNIALPAVASCAGRIYVLKNTSGANSVIDSYLDANGNPTTVLPSGVTWLQSDGIIWHQVN